MKNLSTCIKSFNTVRKADSFFRFYQLPLSFSICVVLITFIYSLNQKYLFDWDACFRAFSAFAGRDIIVKTLKGDISSILDIKEILTKYSDFYEARPGSLISYPPGQTFIIGIMSFISVNQFFISLFNVCCFMFLSIGIWKIGEKIEFPMTAKIISWSTICLHPTIILTIWSMRRGLFEATIVCWCFLWLIEFYRKPEFRYILLLIIAVVYGFLYRETLALIAPPTAFIFFFKLKDISWNLKRNKTLICISAIGILIATAFTSIQVFVYSKGLTSMINKPATLIGKLEGGPPTEFLTIYGYYKGQFPPEEYLGLSEEGLKKSGAPEVCRLAIARWSLPLFHKIVYILSGIFVNPISLLFLLMVAIKFKYILYKIEFSLIASSALLYFLMLAPMGGIPDYITPIAVGLGILCAFPFIFVSATKSLKFIVCIFIITNILTATCFLHDFAAGTLEEYPPSYDYDNIIKAILDHTSKKQVGIGIPNYLVKNVAYSKLRFDKDNRLACYSIEGSRLPPKLLLGKSSYERYSPYLKYKRDVPGIHYLLLRSKSEIKIWENSLKNMGIPEPIWDNSRSFIIKGTPRLLAGKYRPLYVMKINKLNKE